MFRPIPISSLTHADFRATCVRMIQMDGSGRSTNEERRTHTCVNPPRTHSHTRAANEYHDCVYEAYDRCTVYLHTFSKRAIVCCCAALSMCGWIDVCCVHRAFTHIFLVYQLHDNGNGDDDGLWSLKHTMILFFFFSIILTFYNITTNRLSSFSQWRKKYILFDFDLFVEFFFVFFVRIIYLRLRQWHTEIGYRQKKRERETNTKKR